MNMWGWFNNHCRTVCMKEKDHALENLASVEGAFSDLHRRYEKLKQVVESYKKVSAVVYEYVGLV